MPAAAPPGMSQSRERPTATLTGNKREPDNSEFRQRREERDLATLDSGLRAIKIARTLPLSLLKQENRR